VEGKRGCVYEWIKVSDSVQPGFVLNVEHPDMTVFILYFGYGDVASSGLLLKQILHIS